MRTIRNSAMVIGLAFILFNIGCASVQTTSGKLLASTALTVDAAMKGWAVWVAREQPTIDQEAAVKNAYMKYQSCMAVATTVYGSLANSSDRTAWTVAADALTASKTSLLTMITAFTK